MRVRLACRRMSILALLAVAGAAAGEDAAAPVTDGQARTAVAALDASMKTSTGADRAPAVRACAAIDHRFVADRLVALALDDQAAQDVRAAAFDGLPSQRASAASVRARVFRWVEKQSETDAGAMKRGDIGVPLDRRSGDAISKGPQFDAAVRASAARATWIASAVRFLAASEAPKDAAEVLRPFLQSPHDDLAVAAIRALGAWKADAAVPDLLLLFRMYPKENRWETSAVAHIGGSNSSAKAEWMRWFGHPLKQRARADVNRALRAAIHEITGRKVTSPEEVDAYLAADALPRRKGR